MKPPQKAKYTSQDIRNQAIEARDELMANVEFLMECIREDRQRMRNYKDKHGDVKYRPVIRPGDEDNAPVLGSPTEVNLEPLASQYRATINSLLQSIRLIQSEILPEDNPEGETSAGAGKTEEVSQKRASLRETFQAESKVDRKPIQPKEPDPEVGEEEAAGVEVKEIVKITNSAPRPWRETTPKAEVDKIPKGTPTKSQLIENHIELKDGPPSEPQKIPPKEPPKGRVGLSPMLRMQLQTGGNRLDSIREKYRDGESRIAKKKSDEE